jgi:CubicO group peptidase (beta-lactamase class C family)
MAAAGTATCRVLPVAAQADDGGLPVSGKADAALQPFDDLMTGFVERNKVPGAALAVTHRGQLVYARGFGFADGAKEPVQPASLFRIASISKPLTAVAVLQLVERGKLHLDDKVVDRMNVSPLPDAQARPDDRWRQITVRQCLQHTGGWDRDKSGDPIGRPLEIARALAVPPPARPVDIVRFMMGRPLDFAPGSKEVYSNLGYLVLGRIIEAATGGTYEDYVKKEVLAPLGIKAAQLGRTLPANRAQGEVSYFDSQKRTSPSLYPPHEQVPLPDGAENLEGFEAHGGWIASAVELVRFASAFDEPDRCPLLQAQTIAEMRARPDGAAGYKADGKPLDAYYGCGWNIRPIRDTGKTNDWHAGFIAGSEGLLVRRWDGLNWAVLFNTALAPDGKQRLAGLIDGPLHVAADRVRHWPESNQFSELLT